MIRLIAYLLFVAALALYGGLAMRGLLFHDPSYIAVGVVGLVVALAALAPVIDRAERDG